MKNIFILFKKTVAFPTIVAMLIASIFYSNTARAQQINLPLVTGYEVSINGLGSTICDPSGAYIDGFWGLPWFWFPPTADDFPANGASYHTLVADITATTIVLDIPAVGYLPGSNLQMVYHYGVLDGTYTEGVVQPSSNPPSGYFRFEMPVTFDRGTQNAYLTFNVFDQITNPPTWYTNTIFIPITVLGPTINDTHVEILDTITEPQIPYLILHAPPGDGSSSSFETTKTTCRKLQTNYAGEESNSANLAVKIGIAGTAGIFVTTDFEFSVTFNAGLSIGEMHYESTAEETCITVTEGFSTSSMLDDEGGGDVFVGYGTDLVLGVYEYLRIEPSLCAAVLDTGLIYAPVGELRQFAKTKTGIDLDIAALEAVVADSANLDAKTVNDAQNQIDVWNQVLDMNLENVNNPNNEPIGLAFDLDGGATLYNQENIKTVETSTIQYEHYTNVNLGVTSKVEVAGSGFEGGYEYKGSKRFGETQNHTEEESQLIKYTLNDDDQGDVFKVQVVRDPMYGTPIFRTQPGTRSSCPYQVGYQRDQPNLMFNDDTVEKTISDIPIGEDGTFQVNVCNESDEGRYYHLKVNPATNTAGLVIEAFGENISATDDGFPLLVPAGDCIYDVFVTIRQTNQSILDYEDVEIYLNVDCQPASAPIVSSIFLDAQFVEITSLSDLENQHTSMVVVPNPNAGQFNIQFDGAIDAGQIFLNDLTGKRVFQKQIQSGEISVEINQGDLTPGIYFLVFQSDTQRVTQKVVINR